MVVESDNIVDKRNVYCIFKQMKERIGQYYFEVIRQQGQKPEFVNRGKMIELDSRGERRFNWKRFSTTLAVISLTVGAGMTVGIEAAGVSSGIPPLEVMMYRSVSDINPGLTSVGALIGGFVGVVSLAALVELRRAAVLNRLFA